MKQLLAINRHNNACKGSQKFANHLINYLYNKLLANAGETDIDDIIAFYIIYLQDWNENYVKWRDALNFQMSTTDQMEILDNTLIKTKAPEWIGKIWGVYAQGTPKATALLPHGRKAFTTGSAINRIAGMNTLITGIGTDASLAAVKTDITNFVTTYTGTSQQHQAAMKDLKDRSKNQEKLRLKTTSAMLRCEGSLTVKFWEDAEKVDLFYDISSMRQRHSKTNQNAPLSVPLLPREVKLINIDYTFKDIWEVYNNGDKDACVFFGRSSSIFDIPDNKIVIPAGESVQIDLSTLAYDMRFAYAANLSAEDDGELVFVLLPAAK